MTLVEGIRFVQVVILAATTTVYALTAVSTYLELRRRRAGAGRVTPLEDQLTVGRIQRQLAMMAFMVGAILSHVDHWDDPLTFRSFCWIFGCTFAWLAWVRLDRRRWEVGLT